MDGAGMNSPDAHIALRKWQRNSCRLLALIREDLNPSVEGPISRRCVVFFAVFQINGCCPRRLGGRGQLEFVGIRRLELCAKKRRRQSGKQSNCAAKEERISHECGLKLKPPPFYR